MKSQGCINSSWDGLFNSFDDECGDNDEVQFPAREAPSEERLSTSPSVVARRLSVGAAAAAAA